jgi:hypothetical protein
MYGDDAGKIFSLFMERIFFKVRPVQEKVNN